MNNMIKEDNHCLNRTAGMLWRVRTRMGENANISLAVTKVGVSIDATAWRELPKNCPHDYPSRGIISVSKQFNSLSEAIDGDLLSAITEVVSYIQKKQLAPWICKTCESENRYDHA